MAENMVRTQVYLPRHIYQQLQERAAKQGLTLAVQIRAALEDYLEHAESEDDEGILRADDPIFQMIGVFDSGAGDLSINHDHYLYCAPKREHSASTAHAVREKPPRTYKAASKKSARRRKAS